MKGLKIFGDYLFEYLIISILLILSFALIIPFIPMLIGVVSYFRRKFDARMLKDIFVPIKDNIKIIIKFTFLELILVIVSGLNIYYINTNPESMNHIVLLLSYVGLILALLFIVHAPVIILNMNVNLKQLIFNSVVLIFGGIKNSLYTIALLLVFIISIAYVPYMLFMLIYFIPIILQRFPYNNLIKFKAIKLGKTVEELTKQEDQDDYLDEYGYVNHSE